MYPQEKKLKMMDLEIYEQGHIRADSEWDYPDISSPFYRIYLLKSGSIRINSASRTFYVNTGECCLIPSNQIFSYSTDGLFEKYYFHFNASIYGLYDIFSQLKQPSIAKYTGITDGMNLELDPVTFLSKQLRTRILFYSILETFLESENVDLKKASIEQIELQGVYDFIMLNNSIQLSNSKIAGHFNRSISSLNDHFKMITGMTIRQYNENYINGLAQKYLLFHSIPILEIAYKLGFNDSYYFSRFFKKMTGLSPRAYRKNAMPYI